MPNIGVSNEGRRQMESRDQVLALCGSSLHYNHSKLSDITAGKLFIYLLSILSKDRVLQKDKPAIVLPTHIHTTQKKLHGQNKEQYKNNKP